MPLDEMTVRQVIDKAAALLPQEYDEDCLPLVEISDNVIARNGKRYGINLEIFLDDPEEDGNFIGKGEFRLKR